MLPRADSGLAHEALMAWSETNRVDFLFGLARNARLVEELTIDLAWIRRATGNKATLLNGQVSVLHGASTGARAGQVLRRFA